MGEDFGEGDPDAAQHGEVAVEMVVFGSGGVLLEDGISLILAFIPRLACPSGSSCLAIFDPLNSHPLPWI